MRALLGAVFCVVLASCASTTRKDFSFNTSDPSALLIYATTYDYDLRLRKIDLEGGTNLGPTVNLPTLFRYDVTKISASLSGEVREEYLNRTGQDDDGQNINLTMGSKIIEPGYYAVVSGRTSLASRFEQSDDRQKRGSNHLVNCFDETALVVHLQPGEVGVLPFSLLRISEDGYTGRGHEEFDLFKAKVIVAGHPNIVAPIGLVDVVAQVRFSSTIEHKIGEVDCGRGESFEVVAEF